MSFSIPEMITSPSGAQLALRRMPAAGKPRAIVQINHGLAEHSLRYQPFAAALAERSCHVFAHDHRGHGHTMALDAPPGQFAEKSGVEKVIADVMAVHALATDFAPGLPVILFGHSMGGMIAANVATSHPEAFDGLAIWNANLHPGAAGAIGQLLLKFERFFKGSDVPSALAPKLTFEAWAKQFPDRKTEFDWLSRDPVEVAAYIADPLCGFNASISLWIDLIDMAIAGGSRGRLARLPAALPVHLVGGGMDPATEKGAAMAWLDRQMAVCGLKNRQLTIYPTMRHETLNEIGRQQAIDDFIDWCDRIAAGGNTTSP